MLIGTSVFPEIILIFNFEKIVCAVVIEDSLFAVDGRKGILIQLRLDKVIFLCMDLKASVDMLQFEFRLPKEVF